MLVRLLLATTLLISSFISAFAATITGSQLFNHPDILFPTTQPTLNGSSLVFGSGADNEKLFVLPLFDAGMFPSTGPATFTVSMNLTRIACAGSSCVSGLPDFDPHILMGDGNNLVGAVIADNNNGEFLGTTLTDAGNIGTGEVLTPIFTGAGFPATDGSFDIDIAFTLTNASTTVAVSFLAGAGTFASTSVILDPAAALSLVFMRDDDVGEQYQVNSVTSDAIPPVPLPAAAWMFLTALSGLGLFGWRRRRAA